MRLEEAAEVEDAADEHVAVRDVGYEDGGGDFADVPVYPLRAVGEVEGVVLGEDCAEDDEEAEGEDGAEDELLAEGEGGAQEDGERDAEHAEVGGDVEDGVDD